MNSIENKNQNQNENEIKNKNENEIENEKMDRRKILRAPWRTTVDEKGNVKYNDKPNDPEYFKKYWIAKRQFKDAERYVCECCDKEIAYGHKARHQKTTYCLKRKNDKMEKLLG